MSLLGLAVAFVGLDLIVLAVYFIRRPWARMRELDYLAGNARRYESWRGGSRTAAGADDNSSADVMRAMLRRQVLTWGVVGAVGAALVIGGFFLR